ncbi:uncharacterized protein LOC134068576 [Sardina pilchardus]|uniref:uncharacterized protein LOC134068576 n=1 Tax=Sardina pilchardus TaxID=27697 RepID=UPI002E0E1101
MFLCKNGVRIKMETVIAKRECTFQLPNVTKEDSGNYTCVYKQTSNTVTGVGKNSIFIQVKDFMMAQIFVNTPHVFEGDNVSVKCTNFKAKPQKGPHIYLCKNETGVQMNTAHEGDTSFTPRHVRKEDSGYYSCVYSIKKHLLSKVTLTIFKNSVIIEVKEQGKNTSSNHTSSQNTPSQTRIIWVTIPVIFLCIVGALSCFYKRRTFLSPIDITTADELIFLFKSK